MCHAQFLNGWRLTFGVDSDKKLLDALRSAQVDKPFTLQSHYAQSESAITGKITALSDPN